MREERGVMHNSQVPVTEAENARGIGWGRIGAGRIINLILEVLSIKNL